jgi:hypothetical protein
MDRTTVLSQLEWRSIGPHRGGRVPTPTGDNAQASDRNHHAR